MTPPRRQTRGGAFTLVEMMCAVALAAFLMIVLTAIVAQTSRLWRATGSQLDQFREARAAFNSLAERLGQATLGTSWGCSYAAAGVPSGLVRKSELRFRSGPGASVVGGAVHPTDAVFFFAPLGRVDDTDAYGGLPGLLNLCGYYVEWNSDSVDRPALLPATPQYHFRLMEFVQPSEEVAIYQKTVPAFSLTMPGQAGPSAGSWQTAALEASPAGVRPLCRNVVALILLPALSPEDNVTELAPQFNYDSEASSAASPVNSYSQLPPVVKVVLYAIDEASAQRLGAQGGAMPELYDGLFANAASLYPNGLDPGDLGRFEANLEARHLNFRRFETVVELPQSRWSAQ